MPLRYLILPFVFLIQEWDSASHETSQIPLTAHCASAESLLYDLTMYQQQVDDWVTYEIVDEGTKMGQRELIYNRGYNFSIQLGHVVEWQCPVRPKVNPCKAKVKQGSNRKGTFACKIQSQGSLLSRLTRAIVNKVDFISLHSIW